MQRNSSTDRSMQGFIKQLLLYVRENLLIYLGWLVVCIVLHTYVLVHAGVTFSVALTDATISNLLITKATFITAVSLRFYLPKKWSSLYIAIDVIAISILVVWGACRLLALLFSSDIAYLELLDHTLLVRMLVGALIVSPIILKTQQEQRDQQNAEITLRNVEMEKQLREAELAYLSRQLQPHFLFNSLNSIYALMGSRPDDARKMLQQLSEFLRSNLRKENQTFISFEEELNLLHLYLSIERVRFGHRLSTPVDSSDEALHLVLPPFILQPVVENAIKFGLYDTTAGVEIRLQARVVDQMLEVQVENPYDAATAKPSVGAGFGLESIGRRLQLIYGRSDLLSTSQSGNVFITRLLIPQPHA